MRALQQKFLVPVNMENRKRGGVMALLVNVQDLLPTANVVTALKKQIAAKH